MTILKGKKLVENIKTENFKYDILGNFQTMCHNIFSPFISISILALVIGSMVETNHDRRWIDQAQGSWMIGPVTQDFIMKLLDSFHWRMTTNHDLQNGFDVVIQLRQFGFELTLLPFQFQHVIAQVV